MRPWLDEAIGTSTHMLRQIIGQVTEAGASTADEEPTLPGRAAPA